MRERKHLRLTWGRGAIFLQFFQKLDGAVDLLEDSTAMAAQAIRVSEVVVGITDAVLGLTGANATQAPQVDGDVDDQVAFDNAHGLVVVEETAVKLFEFLVAFGL